MRPPGNDERGPLTRETASSVVQAGEANNSLAYETPVVVDGALAQVVFDHRWMAGYEVGLVHGLEAGIERGRRLADDEAAAVHRQAVSVVRLMAEIEPHEVRWQRAVGA